MPSLRPDPPKAIALKAVGRFGAVGFEMAALLLVGVKGGEWLDEALDTSPWLKFAGLFFGIFGGFYQLFKLARPAASSRSISNGPEVDDSDRTRSDAERPASERPGSERPEPERPGSERPGSERPEPERPEPERPEPER